MGQWLGSCQITKYQINLDLIKIIQFSLKIYDLWRHPRHGLVYGWFGRWVSQWVGSCHITKNLIKLDVITIIQFCLKVYDLWRHPHVWVSVWVVGWVNGWGQIISLKIE